MNQDLPPRVSVVVPVRNRPELLDRAIRSVVAQTVSDLEIIVVDDGSDTPISLAHIVTALPIRIIRNDRPLGAQPSRLIGTRAARGAWVALLDSDDWWSAYKLERQLAAIDDQIGLIVACRVVAVRGSLRKEAPWRPLQSGEKVEDFLYVARGMLQTSTIMARTVDMIGLLEASVDSRVHNDTMLFLEAQKRRLRIMQMPDALSFFDDNPRLDRVSYDSDRIASSEAWYRNVSTQWSPEARRGFQLTDMVPRFVNTGQRRKALACLIAAYHPKISLVVYFKKFAYILFNGSPTASLQRLDDRLRKSFYGPRIG